jgi:HD superfamily phosphohydrolase
MVDTKEDIEVRTVKDELDHALEPRYSVGPELGSGGAGIVFQLTDVASNLTRVAKILRPSVRDVEDLKEEFKNEAQKLAHLRHPNLVTVFEQSKPDDPPYFIMEFVAGVPFDEGVSRIAREKPNGRWLEDLRKICLALADVLAYLHSQNPHPLLHLDLKPENIYLVHDYRNRLRPILLDFGISRFAEEGSGEVSVRGTFPMWPMSYISSLKKMTTPGRTVFVIDRKNVNTDLDLHLLGRSISMALLGGVKVDPLTSAWDPIAVSTYHFLTETLDQLDIDKPDAPKFVSAGELRKSLRRLDLRASRIGAYFGDGSVRIPGSTISDFGKMARKLTDWPLFQRLRGIHQLGLTFLVYPGAVHDRLEHSLGVFGNVIEMLDYISGPTGDFRFRSIISDEELVATAIVALLHDVGHYPFAHQFRISGVFPNHDERTLRVIQEELESRITGSFNADIYKAVVALMNSVIAYENPGKILESDQYPNHFNVLRAMISSSIDADKLDYVSRDAHHCGVPYGKTVDHERFVKSLRVWWDADSMPHLLLSDKGRVCAEALVFARYLMTSEVYWNHGVRSYAAMLSAAIDQFSHDEVTAHLWDTDNAFLSWLAKDNRGRWFTDLIKTRRPYRRAFVHQRLGGGLAADETDIRLFQFLENAVGGNKEVVDRIRDVVASTLGIRPRNEYDIVIDVPKGMTTVSGVKVLAEGHEEPGPVGPIFNAIGENFDGFARKVRIFVHPDLMEQRNVAESTSSVRKSLIHDFKLAS